MSIIAGGSQQHATPANVLGTLADAAVNCIAASSSARRHANVWKVFETNSAIDEKFVESLKAYEQKDGEKVSIRIFCGTAEYKNNGCESPQVRDRDWGFLCEAIKASGLKRIHRLSFDRISVSAEHAADLVKALLRKRAKAPSIWVSELMMRNVRMGDKLASILADYLSAPECRPTSVSVFGRYHASESSITRLLHPIGHLDSLESITFSDVNVSNKHSMVLMSNIIENRTRPLKSMRMFSIEDVFPKSSLSILCKHLANDTMPANVCMSINMDEYEDYVYLMDAFDSNTSVHTFYIAISTTIAPSRTKIYDMAHNELRRRRITESVHYNRMSMSFMATKTLDNSVDNNVRQVPPMLVEPMRASRLNSKITVKRMHPSDIEHRAPEHEKDAEAQQESKRRRRE